MLQRIQSIWFFLASATLIAMFFFPIITIQEPHSTNDKILFAQGIQSRGCISSTFSIVYMLLTANITAASCCFINIFNLKNRTFQKRVAIVSILLIIGFAFLCGVYAKKLPGGIEGASFGLGAYLPALAILFIVLAIFGINKDERLIRSAERLR